MTPVMGTVIKKNPTAPVQPSPCGPLRVLLVEDEQNDAVLIATLLSTKQEPEFIVDWRRRPADALDALNEHTYHVCLVDDQMGVQSGLDFIAHATRVAPMVPVILLTTDSSRDADVAAMRAGACNFLLKPTLTARTLQRSIRYAVWGAD
ncbi:MAG: response regulator, partial [Myxococcota bacterium]